MSEYLPSYYRKIREVVLTACPELLPENTGGISHGIFESEHSEQIPWENFAPPMAVILIDSMPSANGEWGPLNDVYQVPVQIYYVAEVRGPVGGIRSALERIRDAFNRVHQDVMQVTRVMDLSWSDALEPNQILAAASKAHRVGRLTVEILMGEGLPNPTEV